MREREQYAAIVLIDDSRFEVRLHLPPYEASAVRVGQRGYGDRYPLGEAKLEHLVDVASHHASGDDFIDVEEVVEAHRGETPIANPSQFEDVREPPARWWSARSESRSDGCAIRSPSSSPRP